MHLRTFCQKKLIFIHLCNKKKGKTGVTLFYYTVIQYRCTK